jgi:hypothetical protein
MTAIKAHFDGHVLAPDEPVSLPVDKPLKLLVEPAEADEPALMKLVRVRQQFPDNPNSPTDGAAQHDHYLYGMPRRP